MKNLSQKTEESKSCDEQVDALAETIKQNATPIARVLMMLRGPSTTVATKPAEPKKRLTDAGLADALDTDVESVRRLARDGRIPFVVVGSRRRYDLAEVCEALAQAATPLPRAAAPVVSIVGGISARGRAARGGARG